MAYNPRNVAFGISAAVLAAAIGTGIYFRGNVMGAMGYSPTPVAGVNLAGEKTLKCETPEGVLSLDDKVHVVLKTDGNGNPVSLTKVDGWKIPVIGGECEPVHGQKYFP